MNKTLKHDMMNRCKHCIKQNDQQVETKSWLCTIFAQIFFTNNFPLQEQIDKFEEAADGINADMALAEKALKVGDGFVCGGDGGGSDGGDGGGGGGNRKLH